MRLPKTGGKVPLPGPLAVVSAIDQVTQNTPAGEGTLNFFDLHNWESGNEERFNATMARERAIERAEREKEFAKSQAASDWVRRISQQGSEGRSGSDRE